jgi:hypothetical protein
MRTRSIFTFVSAFLGAASAVHTQEQERQQIQLPEGNGREIVQVTCSQWHSLSMVTNSAGYTHDGWKKLIALRCPSRSAAPTL